MDAGGDDDDDADLAEQQRSLQEQVAQAQNTRDRAAAELEQATLRQEQYLLLLPYVHELSSHDSEVDPCSWHACTSHTLSEYWKALSPPAVAHLLILCSCNAWVLHALTLACCRQSARRCSCMSQAVTLTCCCQ
jgi:hypothetical protein